MQNLSEGYRALVIGSHGTIGSSLLESFRQDKNCQLALGIARHTDIPIDIANEASIVKAYEQLFPLGPFDIIVLATGVLHNEEIAPKKAHPNHP
jgi:dTDP-4-dehydrorhamnose reductase